MSNEEKITWTSVRAGIARYADDAVADGDVDLNDEDSWYQYAAEQADSSHYVIYTYASRALWMDSTEVQEYEGDAVALSSGVGDSIDSLIRLCVYRAIESEYVSAFQSLADEKEALIVTLG